MIKLSKTEEENNETIDPETKLKIRKYTYTERGQTYNITFICNTPSEEGLRNLAKLINKYF